MTQYSHTEWINETTGILRDQTDGEISPAILRDLVLNLRVYGGIGILNNLTPLTLTGNWQQLALSQSQGRGITINSNTLVVPVDGVYEVSYILQFGAVPPDGVYEISVFKNTSTQLQPFDAKFTQVTQRVSHPGWYVQLVANDNLALGFKGPAGEVTISDVVLKVNRVD